MFNDSNSSAASPSESALPQSARTVLTILLIVVIILGTLGNLLVMWTVLKTEMLRSKISNYFIVALAVADSLVSLLVMPMGMVQDVIFEGKWPARIGRLCSIWVSFDVMLSTASILNLCLISLDRYIAITRPLYYDSQMTARRALLLIFIAWCLAFLMAFVPIQCKWYLRKDDLDERAKDGPCFASFNETYAVISSSISFYIPALIMAVVYVRVFRIAHLQAKRISTLEKQVLECHPIPSSSNDQSQSSGPGEGQPLSGQQRRPRSDHKALKTIGLVMGVFVLCWFPFFASNTTLPFLVDAEDSTHPFQKYMIFFIWLGWTNSLLNPLIYSFNAQYRSAFLKLIQRHFRTLEPVSR